MWVANSATLSYGERTRSGDTTFLTVDECNGLQTPVTASGKLCRPFNVTHAHGDHFFRAQVRRIASRPCRHGDT